MGDSELAILVVCIFTVIVCFFLTGLHLDLFEWWDKKHINKKQNIVLGRIQPGEVGDQILPIVPENSVYSSAPFANQLFLWR